ncbi:hypothetical protein E4U42_003090, partial [Claviceps africana]
MPKNCSVFPDQNTGDASRDICRHVCRRARPVRFPHWHSAHLHISCQGMGMVWFRVMALYQAM